MRIGFTPSPMGSNAHRRHRTLWTPLKILSGQPRRRRCAFFHRQRHRCITSSKRSGETPTREAASKIVQRRRISRACKIAIFISPRETPM
jgi:hypothetical protein